MVAEFVGRDGIPLVTLLLRDTSDLVYGVSVGLALGSIKYHSPLNTLLRML